MALSLSQPEERNRILEFVWVAVCLCFLYVNAPIERKGVFLTFSLK